MARDASVQSDGERSEDRVRIGASVARQSFIHMLEAAAYRDPMTRQKRQLGRTMRQAFKRRETVDRRDFTDGVHLRMDVQRGQASGAGRKVGNALAQLLPNVAERVCLAPSCHERIFT